MGVHIGRGVGGACNQQARGVDSVRLGGIKPRWSVGRPILNGRGQALRNLMSARHRDNKRVAVQERRPYNGQSGCCGCERLKYDINEQV